MTYDMRGRGQNRDVHISYNLTGQGEHKNDWTIDETLPMGKHGVVVEVVAKGTLMM